MEAYKKLGVVFSYGITKIYASQYILAKELNLSQTTIGKWLAGRTYAYHKHNIKSIKFINV